MNALRRAILLVFTAFTGIHHAQAKAESTPGAGAGDWRWPPSPVRGVLSIARAAQ